MVAGKIPAKRTIVQACQRHLDDLKAGIWRFDQAKANRAGEIIEQLRHVKGKWKAQRLILSDWQCFIVASIFGWVDQDGLRRFRQVFALIPRKNGKSLLAAAIGLVLAFCDYEAGAEVYCGATTEKQAWMVFEPAKLMARGDFAEAFGVKVAARSLFSSDASKFVPIIGDPGDGASPHASIVDEYHEHKTSDMLDTMVTGMGARTQPLTFVITTAGDNVAGPCFELQKYCESVLAGDIEDERTFAVIYGIDEPKSEDDPAGDDWRDFAVWKKANPNFGVSVLESYLHDRWQEALTRPAKQGVNLTKNLNVWVTARSAWINRANWLACTMEGAEEEDFAGGAAYIGCDLASKIDVAAIVARVEAADGRVCRFPRLYVPESALAAKTKDGGKSKNAQAYAQWVEQGWMIATPGEALDFAFIERDIRHWLTLFDVKMIGFDPWQANDIMQRLLADDAPVVEYGMTVKNLSRAMTDVEAEIEKKQFFHPGNPAFGWMATNVVAKEDARGNKYPRKPDGQPHLKIDAMVAALMAEGLALADAAAPPPPNYDILIV